MKTLRICVYGIVQGVGFRPFVSRIAKKAGVTGSVANRGSYVEIYVRGDEAALCMFQEDLRKMPPERSAILKIDTKEIKDRAFESFEIIESEHEEGDIFVSPDIATCEKCKAELFDPKNRRYMHPFINCTACGPRLTILDSMPYDRERTSMGEFPMCPDCAYEYEHAHTRRYDAQPVCCNDCGPEVYLIGKDVRGSAAITAARQAIMDGQIVAIKGIGGFHLCCDATNETAVRRLRELKHRPAKPFAVMMRSVKTVERECLIAPESLETLDNHQKPIILFRKRKNKRLAPSVAPDNPNVGVMLPYAPVQMLLFDYNDGLTMTTDCFVMTSGNVSGAPICRTDEDAVKELSGFCDIMLSHNRKIRLRADDSVMDYYQEKPYMIRRSRGYAPLPVMLSNKYKGHVLAVGGELKNTFCIGKNGLFYPSPYVGDMADLRTVRALEESIDRMETLLEAAPTVVACDMHPKYNTTLVAKEQGIPVIPVQHHYAHVVSCMAENDYDQPVIGVSFDGTGYGLDGTVWGGEFFRADYSGFTRLGSIRPFLQVGGDSSAKEGWRIAVSMVRDIYKEEGKRMALYLGLCDETNYNVQSMMAKNNINSVISTSAGRLFDAVSAILGIRRASTYEGEAATSLMFHAEGYAWRIYNQVRMSDKRDLWSALENDERVITTLIGLKKSYLEKYPKLLNLASDESSGRFLLRTDELVRIIVKEKLSGVNADQLSWLFHDLLAMQIAVGCEKAAHDQGIDVCAFSGGVFQNKLLLRLCENELKRKNIRVLKHSLIPPNDGGIALGQAVVAMHQINQKNQED